MAVPESLAEAGAIFVHELAYPVAGQPLEIPTSSALNLHDALLPRYPGVGTVISAGRNGETETG